LFANIFKSHYNTRSNNLTSGFSGIGGLLRYQLKIVEFDVSIDRRNSFHDEEDKLNWDM